MTQFVMFFLCSVDQVLTVFKKEFLGEKSVPNLGQTQDGLSAVLRERTWRNSSLVSDGARFPVYRGW